MIDYGPFTCLRSGCPTGTHETVDCPPAPEPSTFTGDQGNHDIRAVQLRAENFSIPMIQKAGRLFVNNRWSYGTIGQFEADIWGDSGEVHQVRVFGERTWFATCTCPARASRWNRAGACAHRALGGWLRAQQTGQPIPRWPDLTLEEWK